MHFVYILECRDRSLYTGYTNDIRKRLAAHNGGKSGAKYTKSRRPVRLLYKERFQTLSRALKREAEIKGWKRPQKLALIRAKR